MSEERQRRITIAACLLVLLVALLWLVSRPPAADPVGEAIADADPQPAVQPPERRAAANSSPIRLTRTNPVKAALRNRSWKIVARQDAEAEPAGKAEAAEEQNAAPPGIRSTQLSLEFVRANFDAAGMRGVERFAAFSPPQFAAIKAALKEHGQTSISTAPDEFAPDGETVYYDLVNAEDEREFAIEFTPRPDPGSKTLRLRIATSGSTRRRDTVLPIWDGQTVMVPLAPLPDSRARLALFITVRLVGEDGRPVNEFLVWE